jgi:hypothetical protein
MNCKKEVDKAKEFYAANPTWPVLDVTYRAVEVTNYDDHNNNHNHNHHDHNNDHNKHVHVHAGQTEQFYTSKSPVGTR